MGFLRKVPPDVVGFHMAYLLQEESGERNTFFTEFSGLKMVSAGASVVPEVLSAVQPLSVLYWGSGSPWFLRSASLRKCRFPSPTPDLLN